MAAGTRFEFTQEQFDLLCADLRGFPISRVVAASAAVPVFMSPITLRNRAGNCGYPSAAWVEKALQERKLSSRQFHYASKLRSYLDADERPHIHLLDGGLADNLGLRSPLEAVFMQDDAWTLALRAGIADVRKVVFIVVHASTGPDLALNKMAAIPGVGQVLRAFKDIPIDRYSFETKQLLISSFGPWAADIKTQRKAVGDAAGDDLEFALVDVDFDALRDRTERHALMHIPTTWQLDLATVARIRASARTLLDESASFQRLLTDLHSVRRASALGRLGAAPSRRRATSSRLDIAQFRRAGHRACSRFRFANRTERAQRLLWTGSRHGHEASSRAHGSGAESRQRVARLTVG